MTRLLRLCFAIALLLSVRCLNAADPERVFDHPPDEAKPWVYWFWMGHNLSQEGITGDLEALKDAGFGGTVMCNLADICTPWNYEIENGLNPDMVPYASESWWKLLQHAASESRRLGLSFGMGDCAGYDTNGGTWITPALAMKEICFSATPVTGPGKAVLTVLRPQVDPHAHTPFPSFDPKTGKLEKPLTEGRRTFYRDIAVLAVPAEGVIPLAQVINLTGKMSPEGKLEWDAPAGKWLIYRFGYTITGMVVGPTTAAASGLECDKMSPEALGFHLDHLLGEITRHLGDLAGHGLDFIWIDSYEYGDPATQWTPKLPEEFKARRGYDLTPFLPTRAGRVIESPAKTSAFDKDFHATIHDLFRDVYFTLISKKVHASGLKFESEPYVGPWNMNEVVPMLDLASAEFWNQHGQYDPLAVDQVVKASRLAGRNIINSEAFTAHPDSSEWNETPASIKSVGDQAYCHGINRFVLHRFTHEPWNELYKPGVVMGQWGTHFDRTQTWWEPGKAYVQYLTRCQALLQWGNPVAASPGDFLSDAGEIEVGTPKKPQKSPVVQAVHRHEGAMDLYFVANIAPDDVAAICKFNVSGVQPELWDPVRGTKRLLTDFASGGGVTTIPLRFAPHQSYFIVFRSPATPSPNPAPPRVNFPALADVSMLTGPWQIRFDPKWGGPEQPVTFEQLDDWTKNHVPGIRYFSGTAVYTKTFNGPAGAALPQNLVLDLGATHNDLCRVKLNGNDLGVVWTAPWRVIVPKGLLKATGNVLTIEVTNTWANRLIGDEQQPPDCEWLPGNEGHGSFLKRFPDWFVNKQPRPSTGRYCFTTWNYFTKASPLEPSGLEGPVVLKAEQAP